MKYLNKKFSVAMPGEAVKHWPFAKVEKLEEENPPTTAEPTKEEIDEESR